MKIILILNLILLSISCKNEKKNNVLDLDTETKTKLKAYSKDSYNELTNTENKKSLTISEYNTDNLTLENIKHNKTPIKLKTDIYITEYNETENRKLIIDSDEHSVWAYVLDSENKIELDGFLFSCGTIVESVENIKEFINENFQPPLAKRFKNKFSVLSDIKNENIKIMWKEDLIQIFINGTEYLVMDILNRKSYSKAISEKGAYGNPLTDK